MKKMTKKKILPFMTGIAFGLLVLPLLRDYGLSFDIVLTYLF